MAENTSDPGQGENRILDSDVTRCEVTNRGEAVTDALKDAGWKGGPVACVLLHLSPDNEKVTRGEFILRGDDKRDVQWEAHKIWPEADKRIMTTINVPPLDSFTFSDGGLTSDLLEEENVVHFHNLHREGRRPEPLLQADREDRGVGKFCLRIVGHPTKTGSDGIARVKYTVLLFPEDKDTTLVVSAHVNRAEWPGLKLVDGELPVLPAPTAPWGCPIIPIFIPGQPLEQRPRVPSSAALRAAIAAIMRRCGLPDCSRTGAKVKEKWDKIKRSQAAPPQKQPPTPWPEASTPTASQNNVTGKTPRKVHSKTILPEW